MLGSIALVVSALLGQAPHDAAGGPDIAPPAAHTPDVPPGKKEKDVLHPGDLAFDLSFGLPTRSATGELEAELNLAVVGIPWHLGPALAGIRFGLISGSARDTCSADTFEICGLAGLFVGPVLRFSPLNRAAFAPWIDVSVTGFMGGALLSDEASLGGFELPRIDAGIDFIRLSEGTRIGLFAFRSRTLFWGSAPLADGSAVIWGGGVRFANRN